MRGRRIDSLLTINKTGMPEAPNLIQLLDKDVKLLYLRDKSKNKEMYIKGLEMYYAERNKLYDTANKAVERALENNDMEMLKCTYNFILTVYSQGNDKLEMLTKQNQIGSNRIMNFIE